MKSFQLPVVASPTLAALGTPAARRRIDPIDEPARRLGAKRAALQARRVAASGPTDRRRMYGVEPGTLLLVSQNNLVTFLLRSTTFGLLMERTQRQIRGVCLVQTMMFPDLESFDRWCGFEPLRFEDGLLFSKLVRQGHVALAPLR